MQISLVPRAGKTCTGRGFFPVARKRVATPFPDQKGQMRGTRATVRASAIRLSGNPTRTKSPKR